MQSKVPIVNSGCLPTGQQYLVRPVVPARVMVVDKLKVKPGEINEL